ncbi:hypothetical protein PEP31012_00841 [Pandoraea eparura]|uniref:Uncharacterized protein n=1 Tax=Pandoraea eparura TaxID=2508291 RepID=A0A5E4SJT9_9BURK|nr:hypothetical protein [Pandoraea eparura]VVD75970.1 hypothetical protein PEP31012_00841 [Pandoraea eparura]
MKQAFAPALFVALSLIGGPAFASTDFAGPYCDSGCRLIDNIGSRANVIYSGEAVRDYRVCRNDGYSLTVIVNGASYDVPSGNYKNRNCIDVAGRIIEISGSATALVGPIGQ